MGTGNKVTEEQIDQTLALAVTQEKLFFGKHLIVCYQLSNGFTIIGESVCVDPHNFDLKLAYEIAFNDAKSKLWAYEGYVLASKLASDEALINDAPTLPLHE